MKLAGIEEDRLHLAWVSSAEAQRFVDTATAVTDSVKEYGAFDQGAFEMELTAAKMAAESEPIRWLVGKEIALTTGNDVYGRKWDVESYESNLDAIIEREYKKNLIFLAIREGYSSVRDISKRIGLDLLQVSYLLADLEHTNRVEFTGMNDSKPVFAAL